MTLRTKTILGIAFIEIVVLAVLVVSAMNFMSTSNERQLIQRASSSATMFAHAAKDAVLSTDLATLDDLVNEFMTLEDVAYVRILRDDKELACAGDKALLERAMQSDESLGSVDDGIFDSRTPIEVNGTPYAYVDIGFETAPISMMLKDAKKAIVGIASVEVILVAFFSFILGTYLTRGLSRLTSAVHTVRERGPGYQIQHHTKDELGEATRAFDEMSAKLEHNYQDLMSAREGAEQACNAKSRFLASMSHEIRTPMNGVLGILNILEETNLSKEQQKLVSTATESGHFLLSVINDILDFTRMESNTLILEHKTFDFRRCVESVVDSFTPTAENQNLILHCYIEGDVPSKVCGDENRIKQILLNIIGNAMKFTHEGSITVKVSAERREENKVQIYCQVQDTGIGINDQALRYLFDEFTMVDQTYSRTKEGSGLGLAICRRLCNLMDGEVTVKSKPDVGSTFTFDITLEMSDELISSPATPPRQDLINQNVSVLVAEDNRANQLVIREMFKRIGVDIDIAENGLEAVEMSSQYRYDIIFMDISMPRMDGMQACQKIRQMEQNQDNQTPIIALTAHSLAGDKEKFLESGMDDYLSKPIRLSQLVEKINLFLTEEDDTASVQKSEPPRLKEQHDAHITKVTPQNNDNKDTLGLELVDEMIIKQVIEDTSAEVLPILIDHYIEESETRLTKIYQAMDAADKEMLEFESHTLGSSALALGNRTLSNLARKIEHLCLDGQHEQAFTYKGELEQIAVASIEAIKERKQQGFNEPTAN